MADIQLKEFMGENVRESLKYCGKNVILFPLCKIVHPEFVYIDDESKIYDFTFIDGKYVKIGKYVTLTWQCLIEGHMQTTIGDRVFIGPGTKILSSTYKFQGFYTCEFLPDEVHDTEWGDVTIENDAYIGANSVVMPGVTIGEGALVGSNAFVNKDLDPWGIYVGSPVRKVGERQKPSAEMKAIVDAMDWTKHF